MKLARIFLSSLFLWSCDNRTVQLYALDAKKGVAYHYEVTGIDKKTGEFVLEDRPTVLITAPELNNAVCTTYKDYTWGNYKFKLWWVNDR